MSRRIEVSEAAYGRLLAHKREDESVSDVVRRLTSERSLLELAGILDDEDAEEIREAIEDRRTRRG
jgi:predicted CopG family antitoxin